MDMKDRTTALPSATLMTMLKLLLVEKIRAGELTIKQVENALKTGRADNDRI